MVSILQKSNVHICQLHNYIHTHLKFFVLKYDMISYLDYLEVIAPCPKRQYANEIFIPRQTLTPFCVQGFLMRLRISLEAGLSTHPSVRNQRVCT